MQGHTRDGVQELPVVTDHDQSARVALKPTLQPNQGIQVQVIGRFIQKHQVRWAHQSPGQLKAHAPATGEAVDGLVQVLRFEPKAQDQRLRPRHRVVCACIGQGHVALSNRHPIVKTFCGEELRLSLGQSRVRGQYKLAR